VRKALLVTGLFGLLAVLAGVQPVSAQKKEYIQLQRDVALLQEQVRDLQRSHEEKSALLKTLLEQSLDSVNRMRNTMSALEQSVLEMQANNNARVDTLATQVQALGDGIDELRARLGEMSGQMAETRSVLESVDGRLAPLDLGQTAEAGEGGPEPPGVPTGPPSPDVLYSTALRDFIGGNYELARDEFNDYLKFYGRTQLAGNAQFYIGETFYRQEDYGQAISEYDKVFEGYPNSYKIAAAHLKKGYALLEMGREDDGVGELRGLVERFPGSEEAKWARARLERLGVSVPR
jgi:tol-pal system protein YbgF